MSVLLLRLAGPLQAWGTTARFVRRTTESAPTKSGVIGILAAALGIQRDNDEGLARIAALRFGVRIDQPGRRLRDFQTAHHPVTGKSMPLSERFYLADAVFVAALEGHASLVDELDAALRNPVYPPYLGRRSCPPSQPLDLATRHEPGTGMARALREEPWQASEWYQKGHRDQAEMSLTVLSEAAPGQGDGDTLRDQPLSFAAEHRRHGLRTLLHSTVTVSNPRHRPRVPSAQPVVPHDPFDALEEDDL